MTDGGRRTGVYAIDLNGDRASYPNLRSLLMGTLRRLSERDGGFLDRLAGEKARTRRVVARSPDALFDKPGLADRYAAELADGWWVNTNNSKEQTKRWLIAAVRCAGLDPSTQLKLSF